MQLVYEPLRGRFECITAYGEGDAPKAAGLRWERTVQRWHTADAAAANRLRAHADDDTRSKLDAALAEAAVAAEKQAAEADAARALSRATDAEIAVPAPEGLSYLGYQRAGIAYAAARKDCLIADEPGLGKAIQALGLANTLLSDATPTVRMLVIGPKIALWNWMREAERWLVRPHRIAIWTAKSQPDADVVILNYDIASRPAVAAALRARPWHIAVFDEAHALKNQKAARTKVCLGSKKDNILPIPAARRLFLTGTPILNRPVELFPVLNAMAVPEAASYFGFVERFCEGHHTGWGYEAKGACNLGELQSILRERVMVRRLKADVLSELAPKRYSVVELEADTADLRRAVAAEGKAKVASEREEKRLRAAVAAARKGGDAIALKGAIEALSAGTRAAFTEMSKLRHDTAVAKFPQVIEHVVGLLDGSEESILVMAHHSDVIAGIVSGLAAAGHEAAVITGATSDTDRQRAQDDIQGGRKRVFVGSMRACGVAITLTAASTVVFAEQDWTPGIMSQAEDRAHRIGQSGSVLVQHLVVDGSFDATMAKAVSAKGGVIAAALDTEENDDARLVREAADAEVGAEVDARIAEIVADVAAGAERAAAREVAKAAEVGLAAGEELPPEWQAAVLACLRLVAGVDGDYASEANGSGFSSADTVVGHRLAGRELLSRREAVLALHLVRRYRGQLPADMLEMALSGNTAAEEAAVRPQARRPIGRPRLAEEPLSGSERTRRWRERHGITDMSMPGELADRMREVQAARGGSVAATLGTALDALAAEDKCGAI